MPARAQLSACPRWLWMVPTLLLATALTIVWLDANALNGDEPKSLVAAGVLRSGPHSFEPVWDTITGMSPEQALGWPMLLSLWGRVVGWSEFAVRTLPLFAGILTLAWVYRTGRDLFAPGAGLCAALLLSASVFLLTYMAHARAFALVALCATLCLWCYWRVALHPRPSGPGAPAGLLLGSAGLLWLHYFGALLLPVLGLYHLLFVPKNRRWWQPVLLLGLAVLLALPQLPVFEKGLERTTGDQLLQNRALSASSLVDRLVHHMSNGAVYPQAPVSEALVLLLPPALLVIVVLRLRAGRGADAVWLPAFVAVAFLLLVIATNEVVRAMGHSRVRYLIALWPLTALLAGAGLWRLTNRHRRLVAGLLAIWLVTGIQVSLDLDFRYRLGYFRSTEFHHLYRFMREQIPREDYLAVDYHAAQADRNRIYLHLLGVPWATIHRYREEPYEEIVPDYAGHPFTWLLYLTQDRVGFSDLNDRLGLVLCERVLDEGGFTLERYTLHSVERCPLLPVRLEYEEAGIWLNAPEVSVVDGTLRLDAHFYSVDEALLANYSLALHIIDPRSGERVAQGDTGVGPGHVVPLRSEVDLRALPAGEYELRVALYDWRTGERLPARDFRYLESDVRGEMLTLQRFRLG